MNATMKMSLVTNEHGYREAYAWPGGYDIAYYTPDGGMLCAFCANDAIGDGRAAGYEDGTPDEQWSTVAYDVTDSWESAEACDECGRMVGPSYSD